MSESVTITPQTGFDKYDNPQAAGQSFSVRGLVAPGTTMVDPGVDGDRDSIVFTVYLPLRIKGASGWVRTVEALTEKFTITVRGNDCVGRAKEWLEGSRGGVEVIATAETGATP